MEPITPDELESLAEAAEANGESEYVESLAAAAATIRTLEADLAAERAAHEETKRSPEGGEGVWVTPAQIRRVGNHLGPDVDWLTCDCDGCQGLREALSWLGIPIDSLARPEEKGEGDA